MSSPAILYFHPEAYVISGPKLMGRNAAGNSFLKGYASHSKALTLTALLDHPTHATEYSSLIEGLGVNRKSQSFSWSEIEAISGSTLYLPGPDLAEYAWRRERVGSTAFSLCGITHTTASAGAMDAICGWLTSPVQPWDAVICTSQVVKQTVEVILEKQQDFLRCRFKTAESISLPQMPIIPLGINTQEFDYSDADRSRSRSELGIAEDVVVILFSGRLSFHAKAHPLAMYQAIEKAAQGGPVVLIECGWFANEHIEKAFLDAFNLFCSNIKRVVLDGRDENSRRLAWSSADIFCSLSDNFQETFGLTPLEGMAAGLPVVVSDWNGYRDTVRDGIDGFRIPTYQPPSGLGEDLAFRHACNVDNYDMYCGHTSQLVAVDIELATQALAALIHDRSLREQMGNAARTRARQDFDWATIIPRYEELWSELNAMRQFHKNKQGDCGVQDRPGRLDPFILFQSYPTRTLQASDQLQLAPSYPNAQLAYERLIELRQLQMIQFAEFVQLTNNDCQAIFQFLEGGAKTVEQIVCLGAPTARVHIHRSLLWLMKIGLIRAL